MASISQPNDTQFHSKPNAVLAIKRVVLAWVKYSDSTSRIQTGLGAIGGRDRITGKPKVAMMNPDVIGTNFVVPHSAIENGVIELLPVEFPELFEAEAPDLPQGAVGEQLGLQEE